MDTKAVLNHEALLKTLEEHVRQPDLLLWKEPNLNGWAMGGDYGSPDLLTCPKSYSRFTRRIFEVKATNSDLLSDLRKEKWTRYLPICDRMTFAVQDGVDYEKHLRPLPVGIMVYKNGKWRSVRAAPPNMKAEPWPETMWMALMFGRMGHRDNPRLERLEAAAIQLREGEIRGLQHHVWKRLADAAKKLRDQERDLEEREKIVEELAGRTEEQHRRKALERVYRLLGQWPYGEISEDDLFSKWAKSVLESAATSARERLKSETDAGPTPSSSPSKTRASS